MPSTPLPHPVIQAAPQLSARLHALARTQRLVFFAGLPGTGKSLLSQQLAHIAHAQGRSIHLLQWDVARPVFEAHPDAQRYPVVDGVTHSVIRRAVGLWARQALGAWQQRCAASQHLLIGETPFVGHRLIELARPSPDTVEPLFTAPDCCFVIPVPSPAVRAFLAAERQRRSRRPLHQREREDAPPAVLHALWQQLAEVAVQLGIRPAPGAPEADVPYDPIVYQRVYQHLLQHRHVEVMPVETILPTATTSVYDFAIPYQDVLPTAAEVAHYLRLVVQHYPELHVLDAEIAQWYQMFSST